MINESSASVNDLHNGRSKLEEAYYFCNCDRVVDLCQGNPRRVRWFGIGHFRQSSGLRPSYEMKARERWLLIAFIAVSALVVLLLLGTGGGNSFHINLEQLTERNKCPACFGVNICPQIIGGKIRLGDWTKYAVTKFVNQKNVFYADWNERNRQTKLILKKLAHDHELDQLDKTICKRHGRDNCDVSNSVQYLIKEYKHNSVVNPSEEILHGGKIGDGSDILLCPSERKMEYLIAAAKKFNRGQNPATILANVLTTILLNPEPIILEAFPPSEGWPFPEYYGACGRIVAEEYVGRSLTQFIYEPFKTRASLAKQLLEMANLFGENPTNFILYITDPSPDNFAVDETSNKLKVVDLENIIIVDKEELILSKANDSNKLLVSESMDCEKRKGVMSKCFAFSTEDLCKRPLTDHNYYAVCAGILAPDPLVAEFPKGLLHSIPKGDTEQLSGLSDLVEQCRDPSQGTMGLTRVEAAQKLIKLLDQYLQNQ